MWGYNKVLFFITFSAVLAVVAGAVAIYISKDVMLYVDFGLGGLIAISGIFIVMMTIISMLYLLSEKGVLRDDYEKRNDLLHSRKDK